MLLRGATGTSTVLLLSAKSTTRSTSRRILQVEEMSNTGENDDDVDVCWAAGLKSQLTVKAESFLTKPEVIVH